MTMATHTQNQRMLGAPSEKSTEMENPSVCSGSSEGANRAQAK